MKNAIVATQEQDVNVSLSNESMGTLHIFMVIDWIDAAGQHRMKKVGLETYRDISYTDAIHYVQEAKEHNDNRNIIYRFELNVLL